MKRSFILLSISALAATLAFAQSSSTEPVGTHAVNARAEYGRMHYLTKVLALTPAQQAQAHSIFAASSGARASLRSNIETAQQPLEAAVKNNDPGAIEQASATLGNLTAQATAARAKANAALYLILTPEQQAKFSQLQDRGHGWRVAMHRGGYVQ
jgi:Spy/CpxP family protein refolding chaperone